MFSILTVLYMIMCEATLSAFDVSSFVGYPCMVRDWHSNTCTYCLTDTYMMRAHSLHHCLLLFDIPCLSAAVPTPACIHLLLLPAHRLPPPRSRPLLLSHSSHSCTRTR